MVNTKDSWGLTMGYYKKALDSYDKPPNLLKAIQHKLVEYKKSLEAKGGESKFILDTQNYRRVAYTHINDEFKDIVTKL